MEAVARWMAAQQPVVLSHWTAERADLLRRPDLIGDPYAGVSHKFSKDWVQWVNPDAFAQPAALQVSALAKPSTCRWG